jgi:hypothetical protein
MPFTVWDILAAACQTLGMFWNGSSLGLRVLICLLAVFAFLAPAQRERGPRRRSRRRRHRYEF